MARARGAVNPSLPGAKLPGTRALAMTVRTAPQLRLPSGHKTWKAGSQSKKTINVYVKYDCGSGAPAEFCVSICEEARNRAIASLPASNPASLVAGL